MLLVFNSVLCHLGAVIFVLFLDYTLAVFSPVMRLLRQFFVLPVLFYFHVAVVHVSHFVLLIYYLVEFHQGACVVE